MLIENKVIGGNIIGDRRVLKTGFSDELTGLS